MKAIVKKLLENKDKTVPVLSFPSTQLLGINVNELIGSSDKQAEGMKAIVDRCPVGASLNMMDLSVEAEAFGAEVLFDDNEIPNVIKGVIDDIEDAAGIAVPEVGAARTGIYIEGVKKAKEIIKDVPVFCGVIGPYSLAGRLFDMIELMMSCYDDPDSVKCLLEKVTQFLIKYIKAFKEVGADGVIMAEPAAGLLSPDLCDEFSSVYVKRIIEEVGDDNFVFVYHNCGNVVPLIDDIAALGADVYHFGNAIDLKEVLPHFGKDTVVMGNVDPVLFKSSTPEGIKAETERVLNECASFDNFMISSGCDIPADAKWENLDSYFATVQSYYGK